MRKIVAGVASPSLSDLSSLFEAVDAVQPGFSKWQNFDNWCKGWIKRGISEEQIVRRVIAGKLESVTTGQNVYGAILTALGALDPATPRPAYNFREIKNGEAKIADDFRNEFFSTYEQTRYSEKTNKPLLRRDAILWRDLSMVCCIIIESGIGGRDILTALQASLVESKSPSSRDSSYVIFRGKLGSLLGKLNNDFLARKINIANDGRPMGETLARLAALLLEIETPLAPDSDDEKDSRPRTATVTQPRGRSESTAQQLIQNRQVRRLKDLLAQEAGDHKDTIAGLNSLFLGNSTDLVALMRAVRKLATHRDSSIKTAAEACKAALGGAVKNDGAPPRHARTASSLMGSGYTRQASTSLHGVKQEKSGALDTNARTLLLAVKEALVKVHDNSENHAKKAIGTQNYNRLVDLIEGRSSDLAQATRLISNLVDYDADDDNNSVGEAAGRCEEVLSELANPGSVEKHIDVDSLATPEGEDWERELATVAMGAKSESKRASAGGGAAAAGGPIDGGVQRVSAAAAAVVSAATSTPAKATAVLATATVSMAPCKKAVTNFRNELRTAFAGNAKDAQKAVGGEKLDTDLLKLATSADRTPEGILANVRRALQIVRPVTTSANPNAKAAAVKCRQALETLIDEIAKTNTADADATAHL